MSVPHDHRVISCLFYVSLLWLFPRVAEADGGSVRLSEQKAGYQITVFTKPTPLRVGPMDVSVLVQSAITQQPMSDVQVTISAKLLGHLNPAMQHLATTEAATNKLFRETTFELRKPGLWELDVAVAGASEQLQFKFNVEVGEPLPKYLALWSWIAWPVIPILLFVIHQSLVSRISHRADDVMVDIPPVRAIQQSLQTPVHST